MPWSLYETVGEWNFTPIPGDPARILDEHWCMSPYYTKRDDYYKHPTYPLRGVNIGLKDFQAGPLENWTVGALHFDGNNQFAVLTNADIARTVAVDAKGRYDKLQHTFSGAELSSPQIDRSNFLLEIFFKSAPGQTDSVLVQKTDSAGYVLGLNSKGGITLAATAEGAAAWLDSRSPVNDGQWHHIAVVFNRTANLVRYVDGAASGTQYSLASVAGQSVDNTMGYSPLQGLVMSTRSGDLDPGVIVYLLRDKGMDAPALNELVNKKSGLIGLSGISSDVKELLDRERENPRAAAAIELFCYQAKKFLGALADLAAVEVQNRVAQANSQLPSEVINAGVTVRKQSPDTLLYFAIFSPDGAYDPLFISNYAYVYIVDELKRVRGVGDVKVFGSDFGMRIWLKPDWMASLGITANDVAMAIREQNEIVAQAAPVRDVRDLEGKRIEAPKDKYDFVSGDIAAFLRYKYYGSRQSLTISAFDRVSFAALESLSLGYDRIRGLNAFVRRPLGLYGRLVLLGEVDRFNVRKPGKPIENADDGRTNFFLKTGFQWGTEEQKQKFLVPLAKGDKIGCGVFTEPGMGSDVAAMRTSAKRDGDFYILNGEKMWISLASLADLALVTVKTSPSARKPSEGLSSFIIDLHSPGVTCGDIHGKLGVRAGSTGWINFQDVRVPAENRIGEEGEGFKITMSAFDPGRGRRPLERGVSRRLVVDGAADVHSVREPVVDGCAGCDPGGGRARRAGRASRAGHDHRYSRRTRHRLCAQPARAGAGARGVFFQSRFRRSGRGGRSGVRLRVAEHRIQQPAQQQRQSSQRFWCIRGEEVLSGLQLHLDARIDLLCFMSNYQAHPPGVSFMGCIR